jgi:hypothetical protein
MKKAIVHPSLSTLKEMTEDMKGRLVLIKSDGDEWEIIRDPFSGNLTEIEPTGDKVKLVCTAEDVIQKAHEYVFQFHDTLASVTKLCLSGDVNFATFLMKRAQSLINDMEDKCSFEGNTVYVMDDGEIAYVITEDDAQFEYEGVKIYVAFIPEQ